MDALLIIGGLLLIFAGLVWLVMRAFATSLLWGWGSLLPPLTLVFVLRHWARARSAMLLCGLGIIPLVVGMTLLASKDAERLAAIIRLDWLKPVAEQPAELAIDLRGELNGEAFHPQQGELIDGVLSLREGQDFFAQRELHIRLPRVPNGAVRLDVLPNDEGDLPEIELSWLLPEQDLPEARRINRGYTLHLDLQPLAPNRLVGDFHLVLPPRLKTSLSGKVELYRDGLRYDGDVVSRAFDSRDTIAYVVRDYLQRRFASRDVQLAKLPPFTFTGVELNLPVEASVGGRSERLVLTLRKREGLGWSVDGDRYAPLPEVVAAAPRQASTPPVVERVSRPVDRRQRFSLEALLRNPDRYQNLALRAHNRQGNIIEGRFAGLNGEGNLIIQRRMNVPGEVSFTLRAEDIERIELLEP